MRERDIGEVLEVAERAARTNLTRHHAEEAIKRHWGCTGRQARADLAAVHRLWKKREELLADPEVMLVERARYREHLGELWRRALEANDLKTAARVVQKYGEFAGIVGLKEEPRQAATSFVSVLVEGERRLLEEQSERRAIYAQLLDQQEARLDG